MYSNACHSLSTASHCPVGNLKDQTLPSSVSTWPHITFFYIGEKYIPEELINDLPVQRKLSERFSGHCEKVLWLNFSWTFFPLPIEYSALKKSSQNLQFFWICLINVGKYALPIKCRPLMYTSLLWIRMSCLSNAWLLRIQNHHQGKVYFISANACINSGPLKY